MGFNIAFKGLKKSSCNVFYNKFLHSEISGGNFSSAYGMREFLLRNSL